MTAYKMSGKKISAAKLGSGGRFLASSKSITPMPAAKKEVKKTKKNTKVVSVKARNQKDAIDGAFEG